VRILLIDPSDRGGIALYTDLIAQALAAAEVHPRLLASRALAMDDRDYPVYRRLPVQQWGRPEGAGVGFYAGRLSAWARSMAIVEQVVRRVHPEVVHFQFGLNRRLDATMVHRVRKLAPVVWTAHDVLPFERTDKDRARYAAIYRAVDRVVVHGQKAATAVEELAGVAATVIEHPTPRRITHVTRAEARARLGVPASQRLLVAPGFIRSYKGYDLLASVWEELGDEAPQLIVMGELLTESERPVVERLARSPRVRLALGYASSEDLDTAIIAADAVVLPYREASDSGLVHLARALQTPVLASDAPQLAESVVSTKAGIALPRDVARWAEAVNGSLPPPPSPPPPLAAIGRAHLELYESLLHRPGPASQAAPVRAVTPERRRRVTVYSDATDLGGAEVSLRTLLGALDPSLDVVAVGVEQRVLDFLVADRPDTKTVLLEPVRNKADALRIAAHVRAIRSLRPEIFHANMRIPWSCQYGVLAATMTRGTRILAVEHAPVPPANATQRRLRAWLTTHVDIHVAHSEAAAREIEELSGLPRSTLRVIHLGVPDGPLDPIDERPIAGPTVGSIGRLVREKGFDVLIRALTRLPKVAALVIGDGPERGPLERLAREQGVEDRVVFLGWKEDARRWLTAMDVFVVPSRIEGFGLGIVEAMLARVPVIAAAVGGTAEVIIDEETGWLVPPDDPDALAAAIERVLGDEVLRGRTTRLARSLVKTEFTPEIMAGRFEAMYRELAP
jgi:glycosyltransferase involved in cell wall biosynthesis